MSIKSILGSPPFWIVVVFAFAIWAAMGANSLFQSLTTEMDNVRVFAETALRTVAPNPSIETLKPIASEAYLSSVEARGANAWASFTLLGAFKESKPCFVPSIKITNGVGTAEARCPATFANGDATVIFGLDQIQGQWKVSRLSVLLP